MSDTKYKFAWGWYGVGFDAPCEDLSFYEGPVGDLKIRAGFENISEIQQTTDTSTDTWWLSTDLDYRELWSDPGQRAFIEQILKMGHDDYVISAQGFTEFKCGKPYKIHYNTPMSDEELTQIIPNFQIGIHGNDPLGSFEESGTNFRITKTEPTCPTIPGCDGCCEHVFSFRQIWRAKTKYWGWKRDKLWELCDGPIALGELLPGVVQDDEFSRADVTLYHECGDLEVGTELFFNVRPTDPEFSITRNDDDPWIWSEVTHKFYRLEDNKIVEIIECPDIEPTPCQPGPWTLWGPCLDENGVEQTCGDGYKRKRTREIVVAATNFGPCDVDLEEFQECNEISDWQLVCPVVCEVSEWSEWDTCTVDCGGGTQNRERTVTVEPVGNVPPCPELSQTRICNEECCPQHCITSDWGSWSQCSVSCGLGTRTRHRTELVSAECGGDECGELQQTVACDAGCCPSNCEVSEWSEWGPCVDDEDVTHTCGTGFNRTRIRTVLAPEECGGSCPGLAETQSCDLILPPCLIDPTGDETLCVGVTWKPNVVVSELQKKFIGTYIQETDPDSSRFLHAAWEHSTNPEYRLRLWDANTWVISVGAIKLASKQVSDSPSTDVWQVIDSDAAQVVVSNGACVSEDCQHTEWTDWSPCPDCGHATQVRTREVVVEAKFGGECGELRDEKDCEYVSCTVDCSGNLCIANSGERGGFWNGSWLDVTKEPAKSKGLINGHYIPTTDKQGKKAWRGYVNHYSYIQFLPAGKAITAPGSVMQGDLEATTFDQDAWVIGDPFARGNHLDIFYYTFEATDEECPPSRTVWIPNGDLTSTEMEVYVCDGLPAPETIPCPLHDLAGSIDTNMQQSDLTFTWVTTNEEWNDSGTKVSSGGCSPSQGSPFGCEPVCATFSRGTFADDIIGCKHSMSLPVSYGQGSPGTLVSQQTSHGSYDDNSIHNFGITSTASGSPWKEKSCIASMGYVGWSEIPGPRANCSGSYDLEIIVRLTEPKDLARIYVEAMVHTESAEIWAYGKHSGKINSSGREVVDEEWYHMGNIQGRPQWQGTQSAVFDKKNSFYDAGTPNWKGKLSWGGLEPTDEYYEGETSMAKDIFISEVSKIKFIKSGTTGSGGHAFALQTIRLEGRDPAGCTGDPVDCVMGAWGDFGDCRGEGGEVQECGTGHTRTQTRNVMVYPANGGDDCGSLENTEECVHLEECAVDCVADWTNWTNCANARGIIDGCGVGEQTRTFVAQQPNNTTGKTCHEIYGFAEGAVQTQSCGEECPALVKNCGETYHHEGVLSDGEFTYTVNLSEGLGEVSAILDPKNSGTERFQIWLGSRKVVDVNLATKTTVSFNKGTFPTHPILSLNELYAQKLPTALTGEEVTYHKMHPSDPNLVYLVYAHYRGYSSIDELVGPWNIAKSEFDPPIGGGGDAGGFNFHSQSGGDLSALIHGLQNEQEKPATQATITVTSDTVLTDWEVELKCPVVVDCDSQWTDNWKECSKPCDDGSGPGAQSRIKTIDVYPLGGTFCGELWGTQECNAHLCDRDCVVSGWGGWEACDADCGPGTRKRVRTVVQTQIGGGAPCPDGELLEDTMDCDNGCCPVDCEPQDSWGAWSGCPDSVPCGPTYETRQRSRKTHADCGGVDCTESQLSQTRLCEYAEEYPCCDCGHPAQHPIVAIHEQGWMTAKHEDDVYMKPAWGKYGPMKYDSDDVRTATWNTNFIEEQCWSHRDSTWEPETPSDLDNYSSSTQLGWPGELKNDEWRGDFPEPVTADGVRMCAQHDASETSSYPMSPDDNYGDEEFSAVPVGGDMGQQINCTDCPVVPLELIHGDEWDHPFYNSFWKGKSYTSKNPYNVEWPSPVIIRECPVSVYHPQVGAFNQFYSQKSVYYTLDDDDNRVWHDSSDDLTTSYKGDDHYFHRDVYNYKSQHDIGPLSTSPLDGSTCEPRYGGSVDGNICHACPQCFGRELTTEDKDEHWFLNGVPGFAPTDCGTLEECRDKTIGGPTLNEDGQEVPAGTSGTGRFGIWWALGCAQYDDGKYYMDPCGDARPDPWVSKTYGDIQYRNSFGPGNKKPIQHSLFYEFDRTVNISRIELDIEMAMRPYPDAVPYYGKEDPDGKNWNEFPESWGSPPDPQLQYKSKTHTAGRFNGQGATLAEGPPPIEGLERFMTDEELSAAELYDGNPSGADMLMLMRKHNIMPGTTNPGIIPGQPGRQRCDDFQDAWPNWTLLAHGTGHDINPDNIESTSTERKNIGDSDRVFRQTKGGHASYDASAPCWNHSQHSGQRDAAPSNCIGTIELAHGSGPKKLELIGCSQYNGCTKETTTDDKYRGFPYTAGNWDNLKKKTSAAWTDVQGSYFGDGENNGGGHSPANFHSRPWIPAERGGLSIEEWNDQMWARCGTSSDREVAGACDASFSSEKIWDTEPTDSEHPERGNENRWIQFIGGHHRSDSDESDYSRDPNWNYDESTTSTAKIGENSDGGVHVPWHVDKLELVFWTNTSHDYVWNTAVKSIKVWGIESCVGENDYRTDLYGKGEGNRPNYLYPPTGCGPTPPTS